jgi:hypothetical protein
MSGPAQTFASLLALPEGSARPALRAPAARRLHARVRLHARGILGAGRPVADVLGFTEGSDRFLDG